MSSKRFIPLIISFAMVMESVDTTIINTAIPTMAQSLHVEPIALKIALISYLLSLAIFIPISGWLSDKFGLKRMFIAAVGVFTCASWFAGLSHSLWELILARTVQGIGGALMVPLGRLMVVTWFEREVFIQTMNKVVMIGLWGPVLGPLLGGIISTHFSWEWIFWINIPIGVVLMITAIFVLPERRVENLHRLDLTGFLLFGVGLAGLTFALSTLTEQALSLGFIVVIFVLSAVFLLLYWQHSKRQAYPIMDTSLFRFRTFSVCIAGNFVSRLGFGALPFLIPLLLQLKLKFSPEWSGGIVALIAPGSMMTKTVSKKVLAKFGFKKVLIVNTLLIGILFLLLMTWVKFDNIVWISLCTLLVGVLTALQYSGMNPLAYAETPEDKKSNVSSVHSTTIQLSQSFSVAICAFVLEIMHFNFALTFLVMGCLTCLAASVFCFLSENDGKALSRGGQ